MRGYVRQRGRTWSWTINLGVQPRQCCQNAECGAKFWIDRRPHECCPECGGQLVERSERRQEEHGGYPTKTRAEEVLNESLVKHQQGTYVTADSMTVRHFLTKEWLPAIAATVRPSTLASYEGHVHTHLIPEIGAVRLQKLTPARINAMYATLLCKPRASKRKVDKDSKTPPPPIPKLSPTTVRRIHATLHRALKDAVRWNMIPRNPCDSADPPKVRTDGHDMKVWTAEEQEKFLAFVSDDRLYALWRLLIMTGARRGECCGLRWADVDLVKSRISISQTRTCVGYKVVVGEPKTPRSRRSVALDPDTVSALKVWKSRQLEDKMERQRDKLWTDTGYVFTLEDGQPYHPGRVSRLFNSAVAKSKLPRIRLHDTRHSHASLLLAAGIHCKAISARLGHSNIGTTMNIYAHCIPELDEEAAVVAAASIAPKQAAQAH